MLKEVAEEEERAREKRERKERGEGPNAVNYGPGDMRDLGRGYLDEGDWENSKDDDGTGLILEDEGKEEGKEGEDNESGLIIDTGGGGGLIF